MQLQFRQTEIVEALKQYIVKQGINLQGKSVDISFTAGRKDAGLQANISIEDPVIPGVDEAPVEGAAPAVKPALSVVPNATVVEAAAPAAETKPADPPFVPDAKPEVAAAAPASAEDVPAAVPEKKTASLFG